MAQTNAEQRAELADIVRQLQTGAAWWGSPEGARARLLELLPALLADAEALAAIEAQQDRTRAALTRLAKLSEEAGLYERKIG